LAHTARSTILVGGKRRIDTLEKLNNLLLAAASGDLWVEWALT
jgi:hypothetical protein